MKEKLKPTQLKIFAVLFIIMVGLTGVISDYKLMNFYINDETDYNEWNAELGSKFATDYNSNLWRKYSYVNLNGAMHRILGHHEMNNMVRLYNDFLIDNGEQSIPVSLEDIAIYAEFTGEFSEAMKERGTEYIFVVLPATVDKYDTKLPAGIDDFTHDNLDNIALFMGENGVEVLDLRDRLAEEGKESYDIFYRTDHHWSTEGGFWAYNEIMDHLEKKHDDIQVDGKLRSLDNYIIEKYPEWHLGNRGQRTGRYFVGMDDFDLILPGFDNYIEVWGQDKGGTIEEMMIDRKSLSNRNYENRYTYDSVLGGTQGRWHNPYASVKKNVTVVSDSMSRAVLEYFALTFENVDFVFYNDVKSTLNSSYMDEFDPDIIISMTIAKNTFNRQAYLWPLDEL